MRVLVTGASGLVGSALVPVLEAQGHQVLPASRTPRPGSVHWDPATGEIDGAAFEGVDAVVHLAGSSITAGKWSDRRKREILDSRAQGTRVLVSALAQMAKPPEVLVSSSAIGFYGNRGDEILTEASESGHGFLAEVCRSWEAEAARATEAGIRAVMLRTGIVMTPAGGALAKVLPVFRSGFGGPVGGGRQWMSWISLDDMIGVIVFALFKKSLSGPVNAVSPNPVTNAGFAGTLGKILGRPTVAAVPATVLKLMYGEMAEETVLASTRVEPARLTAVGFAFRHATLEPALRQVLGK